jgi:mycothiol system anti-sigma-R factor
VHRVIGCEEAVEQLWEYLDHDLDAHDHQAVEKHLAFCKRCCGELEFAKHLRRLLATKGGGDLTGATRERLGRFIDGLADGGREDA